MTRQDRERRYDEATATSAAAKRRGLFAALAVVAVGIALQLAVVLLSDRTVGLLEISLAFLALAPLAVAVAGVLWLIRRFRSGS
ncbi:hypothetical protein OO015_05575 [Thermomicrobium sp. 4228-Ro]|uniref:hypothetical protein n=1 Tax=Thermomicrobium sp. 4228-Ro TaxID=2993937 RepID=UPI002248E845|nr:hypothetical protein [Thermomicrobium sp. 4228-Ro]MCX2726964.1 hypothetical protein [Thermomicrobium sp. 4228-Ro]